jgi:large subunit ribosomal protein L10
MVSKEQKKVLVADLVEKLEKSSGVYLVDFTGVTAAQSVAFRNQFRDVSAELKVAKNTLLKRAIAEIGKFELPDDKYVGQSAIAFGYDDPVAPAPASKKSLGKRKSWILKPPSLTVSFLTARSCSRLHPCQHAKILLLVS